ncbi:MFS transporter [Sabulicella rubraurantiaca]|uniref:MFS transporter n=1 Tax=Sabulicella rubraurantiaca TaxID=2811429 RepID=UPI001A95FE33|nr:MFS transporter [Sabulicella rubraurantiaca]
MPRDPSVWTVMLALMGTHLAGMGAFLAVPVLAPAIAAETGLPAGLAGFHTSLVYAGALVSGPLTAGLLRRHGGVRVCQGALVTVGLGIALAAIGHPIALVLSALLSGLGHGPVTPAGSHLLAPRTPPARRSLIFGLKQCGVPMGAMMVAALAPLLALIFGWRGGVLGVALFSVLLALALQPLRAVLDADRQPDAPPLRPFAEARASLSILRDEPRIRALTIASASFGIGQFSFSSFFVVWQVEVLGRGLEAAGLALALAQCAGVVGRVLWAVVADRVGAPPVLVTLGVIIALASLGFALAGPSWPEATVLMLGAAMGASAVAWNGVLLGEVARLAPEGRVGAATAALGFVFAATMVVAPSGFSLLVLGTGGYGPGFFLCAVAALTGVIALRGLRAMRG